MTPPPPTSRTVSRTLWHQAVFTVIFVLALAASVAWQANRVKVGSEEVAASLNAFGVVGLGLVLGVFALFAIRQYRLLAGVFQDQNRRLDGLLQTVRNQNEELEGKVAERTQELSYKAQLLELAPDAILVVSSEPAIQYWNLGAEAMYGFTREEALGRNPVELLNTRMPLSIEEIMGQAVRDGFWEGEFQETRKDGAEITVLTRWSLQMDENGVPTTILGINRDVTAEKKVREELSRARDEAEEASQAKSLFVANMSHELRTPLNAIIGYSEILQDEAGDLGCEAIVPDLQKIQSAGKHLLALINDILDLSKIEAGKMELFLEPLDVPSIVAEVANTIAPLADKRGNTLEARIDPTLPGLVADGTKLRQSLFNLLSNACKFTEHGRITLDVFPETIGDATWVTFEVADSGIGIAPEALHKLFQEFSQADASTTRKYGGTGLGLAISQRFCQMLGGNIAVQSELGQGSRFTLRLPGGAVRPSEPAAPLPREADRTVLVIDDAQAMRDLMKRFLEKEGYHVVLAAGGDDGLRLAREFRPSVITLDVVMPGMDGWSVLTALKSGAETAHIPVVMISMDEDRTRGRALAAADYLVKPVDRLRLTQVLDRLMPATPGATVLVVDDDELSRRLLRRNLEADGLAVIEARSGLEGLQAVEAHRPGLVILDLLMEGLDGFGFVEAMQARPDLREIPVIVVSSLSLNPEERQRLKAGVEAILTKGAFGADELVKEVRHFVRASAAQAGKEPCHG